MQVSISSIAQSNGPDYYNRIGIGDKVPEELPLMNIVNYTKPDAKISDFKGKWLILDYWFTGCGPCIASWPKLTQLQRKYGDKIQIVLVNHMQDKKTVSSFIEKKNTKSKDPFKLPSVTGDTVLYRYFPPAGYPSIVWIDPEGMYRASTSGADLNDKTIEDAFQNKSLNTLRINTTNINLKIPLFLDQNGGSGKHMLWYSTVSKYSDEVKGGLFEMHGDSLGYVIAVTHLPILELITRAYCDGPFNTSLVNYIRLPRTRIELKVKDPTRLRYEQLSDKSTNNLYTYQLISYKPTSIKDLKEIMKDDIRKYFSLELKWEKKNKPCLVLTAQDTTLLGDGRHGAPIFGYDEYSSMFLKDVPVYSLLGYMTEYIGGSYNAFDGLPLINETGYKGRLDITLKNVTDQNVHEIFRDYQKLNDVLAKYKLRFALETREVDVLTVGDNHATSFR